MWHSAGVSAPAAAAPSGVVTFLFTDVEGSTRRWEADADLMRQAHGWPLRPRRAALASASAAVISWKRCGGVLP
jgi:hypothetical protein